MEVPLTAKIAAQASELLDDASDAMFVCDAITGEVLYINDTACHMIGKTKRECFGKRCYRLFWDQCRNCDRCLFINENYYEENVLLKDGVTRVHLRARMGDWNGKKVKIHYLHETGTAEQSPQSEMRV